MDSRQARLMRMKVKVAAAAVGALQATIKQLLDVAGDAPMPIAIVAADLTSARSALEDADDHLRSIEQSGGAW